MTTFPSPDCPRKQVNVRLLFAKKSACLLRCRNKYDKESGPTSQCNLCKTWYHRSRLKTQDDVIMNRSIHYVCCVIPGMH